MLPRESRGRAIARKVSWVKDASGPEGVETVEGAGLGGEGVIRGGVLVLGISIGFSYRKVV
jgi:hypothetical protein